MLFGKALNQLKCDVNNNTFCSYEVTSTFRFWGNYSRGQAYLLF